MRKHFIRIQSNEIPKYMATIKSMFEAGFSLSTIGKHLKRDHTTILYWLAKMGIKQSNKKKKKGLIKEIETETEREKELESTRSSSYANPLKKETFIPDCCLMCKKEKKDLKFGLTNYCSVQCWDDATKRKQGRVEFF